MGVNITIETENAAFHPGKRAEIARILKRIAARIENGEMGGKCMDLNGNSVGTWEVD